MKVVKSLVFYFSCIQGIIIVDFFVEYILGVRKLVEVFYFSLDQFLIVIGVLFVNIERFLGCLYFGILDFVWFMQYNFFD